MKQESGNGLKLILAWAFVGIPLTWGVVQTCINALKLFNNDARIGTAIANTCGITAANAARHSFDRLPKSRRDDAVVLLPPCSSDPKPGRA